MYIYISHIYIYISPYAIPSFESCASSPQLAAIDDNIQQLEYTDPKGESVPEGHNVD